MDEPNETKFEIKPQLGKRTQPLIALKSFTITLPSCQCEYSVKEGQEVHGLKREDREHLKFHGFIG